MILSTSSDQKGSKTSIIQTLRTSGALSRIDLARETGLSRATVSTAVAELIDAGLVEETETLQSTGGRPATSLSLAPRSHFLLGAEFNNNQWTLGAFDLIGSTEKVESIPVEGKGPEAAIQALAARIGPFIQDLDKSPIELIGLGMPGLIDTQRGVIRSAADLEWQDVDIGRLMTDAIGWPCVVLNRHKARGLTECRYGTGQGNKHMIYLGISTGIASGLFYDQHLIFGAIGGAGEVGHVTVDPDGPMCPCGNNGCLQVLAAAPAIELEARRLLRLGEPSDIDAAPGFDLRLLRAEDVCRRAEQGDPLCMQVIRKAGSYLGIAMANLVNIFNPEAIVLGGSIPAASDLYVEAATKVMKQRAMGPLVSSTAVNKAMFRETGGALGAANFALDQHVAYPMFYPKLRSQS